CAVLVSNQRRQPPWVEVAHRDPAKEAQLRDLTAWPLPLPGSEHFVAQALSTGAAQLYPTLPNAPLESFTTDPLHRDKIRQFNPTSCIVAPLVARGRVLGAIVLGMTDQSPPLGEDELALAEELARYAALMIDNVLLYQAEQHTNQRLRVLGAITDATLAHA